MLHYPAIKSLTRRPSCPRWVAPRVAVENHCVIRGLSDAVASALLRDRLHAMDCQLTGLPAAFLDACELPRLPECPGISRAGAGARVRSCFG